MKAVKRISAVLLAVAIMFVTLMASASSVKAAGLHTVTFLYGTKSYVTVVPDGGVAFPPSDVEVPGYTFVGWVGDCMNVTEDRIILGAYVPSGSGCVTGAYTVKFVDGLTGQVYDTQGVALHGNARPICPPVHDGFTFVGFDKDYRDITGNVTIVAKYVATALFHKYFPCYGYWWYGYFPYYGYYPYAPYCGITAECVKNAANAQAESINEFIEESMEFKAETTESMNKLMEETVNAVNQMAGF